MAPAPGDFDLESARARHRESPKAFACFLSKHNPGSYSRNSGGAAVLQQGELRTADAEAKLVQEELQSLLEVKVFLSKCKQHVSMQNFHHYLSLSPLLCSCTQTPPADTD